MSEQTKKKCIAIRVPVEIVATAKEMGTAFLTGACPRFGAVVAEGRAALVRSEDVAREILAAWPSEPTTDYAKRLAEIEANSARCENKFPERVGEWSEPYRDRAWLLAQLRAASEALTAAGITAVGIPSDSWPLAERISVAAPMLVSRITHVDSEALLRALREADEKFRAERMELISARKQGIETTRLLGLADGLAMARRIVCEVEEKEVEAARAGQPMAPTILDTKAVLRAAKVLGEDGALGEAAADILRAAALLRRVALGTTVEHTCADPKACPLCAAPTLEESATIVERLGGARPEIGPWPEPTDEELATAREMLRGDRLTPTDTRPETGPMRFGDDRAGVFLRGDYAGPMAMWLRLAIGPRTETLFNLQIHDLADTLAACDHGDGLPGLQQMRPFAECAATSEQRLRAAPANVQPPCEGGCGPGVRWDVTIEQPVCSKCSAVVEMTAEARERARRALCHDDGTPRYLVAIMGDDDIPKPQTGGRGLSPGDLLAKLMTDPAARARFNGSRARIAVLDAPTPPERRGAAVMREWLNNNPNLALKDKPISVGDLAVALGISEEDMRAIEAGTKTTDDAGWTEIQNALFCLGSGMKPEHIADPTSDPDFAKALDAAEEGYDDAPEETDPAGHSPEAMWSDLAATQGPQTEEDREAVDLKKVYDLTRKLIQSANLHGTSGERASLSCDEEAYSALVEHFEVEREAERIIPGLVCAECDEPIYRGAQYAGKGGHAAHRACRNWPKGTTFKTAGEAQQGAAK